MSVSNNSNLPVSVPLTSDVFNDTDPVCLFAATKTLAVPAGPLDVATGNQLPPQLLDIISDCLAPTPESMQKAENIYSRSVTKHKRREERAAEESRVQKERHPSMALDSNVYDVEKPLSERQAVADMAVAMRRDLTIGPEAATAVIYANHTAKDRDYAQKILDVVSVAVGFVGGFAASDYAHSFDTLPNPAVTALAITAGVITAIGVKKIGYKVAKRHLPTSAAEIVPQYIVKKAKEFREGWNDLCSLARFITANF